MDDPSRVYTIIQEDLPAANGIIHIIDRPITKTLFERPTRDEQVRLKGFFQLVVQQTVNVKNVKPGDAFSSSLSSSLARRLERF